MEFYTFITILLIPIIIGLILTQKSNSNYEYQVKELCRMNNLENHSTSYYGLSGEIKISGKYMDYPLELYQIAERAGKSARIYTLTEFTIKNPKLIELHIQKEFGESLAQVPVIGKALKTAREGTKNFFNSQDILTGDNEFDDSFNISGKPEEKIKNIMTKEITDAFKTFVRETYDKIDVFHNAFEITVKHDKMIFRRKDECPDYFRYTRIFRLMSELAKNIDEL